MPTSHLNLTSSGQFTLKTNDLAVSVNDLSSEAEAPWETNLSLETHTHNLTPFRRYIAQRKNRF